MTVTFIRLNPLLTKNVVEAQHPEGSDHLADLDLAWSQTHGLSDGNTHSRCDLHH